VIRFKKEIYTETTKSVARELVPLEPVRVRPN